MANKYLSLLAGKIQEVVALVTSSGAGDAGKIPALDASGKLDQSLMPVGVVPEVRIVTAVGSLAASDLVNIFNNSGTPGVRKADASNGYPANGFVLSGYTNGQSATVYLEGVITGKTGLTIGALEFLSDTPGLTTETAPTTTGHIVQQIGYAMDANTISFNPQLTVTLA